MNFGSVSAVNQTNGSIQSQSTTYSTVATNTSTNKIASTTLTTNTKNTTSLAKVTTVKVSSNAYGLTLVNIKNGLSRVQNFYYANNRLPAYVSYGTTKIPIATFQKILANYGLKIVTKSNVWVNVKNLVYDHQDTSYTCGPSSLKMELSNYGLTLNEMGLASYAGTSSSTGSTHSGLINAVNRVNAKYGTHLKAFDSSFSSVRWTGLYKYISSNHPVILHIRSFLNPNGGHYVVLTGLNLGLGLAKIADPSYGYRTITLTALESRINWVVSTGRTTKPLIFVT
jgi:hypothetical protein